MPKGVQRSRSFMRSAGTGQKIPGGRIHQLPRDGFYTDRLRHGSSVCSAATRIYREHTAAVLECGDYFLADLENLGSLECQVLIREFEQHVLALNERLTARLSALTSNTVRDELSLIMARPFEPAAKKDEELSKMLAKVTISAGGDLPEKCSASPGAAGPSGHQGRKDDAASPRQDD